MAHQLRSFRHGRILCLSSKFYSFNSPAMLIVQAFVFASGSRQKLPLHAEQAFSAHLAMSLCPPFSASRARFSSNGSLINQQERIANRITSFLLRMQKRSRGSITLVEDAMQRQNKSSKPFLAQN